ncbi:MAG TPA: riboflavin synthase [Ferruginibacter sp.]|nr:riboflavin synthase [Ferruginibacter sp.]
MFTGIIEVTGIIQSTVFEGTNKIFWISSPVSNALKVDQSVSHNGVCLTIDALGHERHRVTAIEETLLKTTMNDWYEGNIVNLERCLKISDRLDGHIVQGHIDTVAKCISIREMNGSSEIRFEIAAGFESLIIEKGSIAINGISFTLFDVSNNQFTVAIIPYTMQHTNMQLLQINEMVNIEFDMIGKYINRIAAFK